MITTVFLGVRHIGPCLGQRNGICDKNIDNISPIFGSDNDFVLEYHSESKKDCIYAKC